jgi:hypothetical protein
MQKKRATPIFELIKKCNDKSMKEVMSFSKAKNLASIGDLIRYSELELGIFLSQETIDILKKMLHSEYNLEFSQVHSEDVEIEEVKASADKGKGEYKKTNQRAGGEPPIHGFDRGPRYGIKGF